MHYFNKTLLKNMSITTINTRPKPHYNPYWKPGGAGIKYQGIARFKVDDGPYRQATHEIVYGDRSKHNYAGFPMTSGGPGMTSYKARAVLIYENARSDPDRRRMPHGARTNLVVGGAMQGEEEFTPTYGGLVPSWFRNFYDKSKGKPNEKEEMWKKSQKPVYTNGPANNPDGNMPPPPEPGLQPTIPVGPSQPPPTSVPELPQYAGQLPVETGQKHPMIPIESKKNFTPKQTGLLTNKELLDPHTIYGQPKGIEGLSNLTSSHVR